MIIAGNFVHSPPARDKSIDKISKDHAEKKIDGQKALERITNICRLCGKEECHCKKTCPRCGDKRIELQQADWDYATGIEGIVYYISCLECGFEEPKRYKTIKEAINGWNRVQKN